MKRTRPAGSKAADQTKPKPKPKSKRTKKGNNAGEAKQAPAQGSNGNQPVSRIGLPALRKGRPRKIETPERFDELVDEYVNHCMDTGMPITWTGMALSLGFYGRQELDNYANYEGFSRPVKRAKSIVEHVYEMRLGGSSASGAIFALKNFGWTDERSALNVYRRNGVGQSINGESEEVDSILVDTASLDDETLDALMGALSAESIARENNPNKTGRGRIH